MRCDCSTTEVFSRPPTLSLLPPMILDRPTWVGEGLVECRQMTRQNRQQGYNIVTYVSTPVEIFRILLHILCIECIHTGHTVFSALLSSRRLRSGSKTSGPSPFVPTGCSLAQSCLLLPLQISLDTSVPQSPPTREMPSSMKKVRSWGRNPEWKTPEWVVVLVWVVLAVVSS